MKIQVFGRLFTEYVSDLIILNKKGEIVWCNHIAKKICNEESVIGKNFSQVFPIKVEEIIKESKIIKVLSGNIYSVKAQYIEEEEMYLIFIEELTDFNNKDIKIYCLEKIIQSINDGVMMSDYEGRIALYNKAQENLEGLLSQNVVGKYLWEAYNYNPEMSEHRSVYKSQKPIINKYRAHVFKNGIPKYLSYSTYPIIKDGEPIAVYSISKNETNLQALLSETIELKRKLFNNSGVNKKKYKENGTSYTFSDIIGSSETIKNLIKEAETISLLNNTVLIVGETGTGKELFAQSIHNLGKNKDEPFVAINCAAIPENLLESILFGTTKGAYTGSVNQNGLFQDAKNGTLFLDELNSMPISMQSKLLRVLQEKVVRKVGGNDITPIKCRVITAINEDPQKIIKEGKLRQDLFYRISGVCLYIPPMRERKEDILTIGEYFIKKYNGLLSKNIKTFSKELKKAMKYYGWPGNVRELEHVIENMMIRVKGNQYELTIQDIPRYLRNIILSYNAVDSIGKVDSSLPEFLRKTERKIIIENLNKNKWNMSQTARELGIIRQSLEYRIKKLGIKRNY